jgi:putative FmdB family regulatory protein
MALIDFECKKCGNKFFEIISPKAAADVKCPKCGSETKRVYKEESCGRHSSGGSSGCGGSCGSCSGCH